MSAADAEPGPLIFMIAGEPSGDALGARLMAALKGRAPVRFAVSTISRAELSISL